VTPLASVRSVPREDVKAMYETGLDSRDVICAVLTDIVHEKRQEKTLAPSSLLAVFGATECRDVRLAKNMLL
jgi:hypothetical protein